MIDGKNFFDQPVKNNKVTYENIRKIATGFFCFLFSIMMIYKTQITR